MSTSPLERGHRRLRRGASALVLSGLLSLLLAGIRPAVADAAPVSAQASITWAISKNAFATSGSLVQSHAVEAPATESPAHVYNGPVLKGHATEGGFSFPGGGTFTPETGAALMHFAGAVVLGNVDFGNLRIRLADPVLSLSGTGSGSLVADVGWCIGAADCADGLATTPDVTVVEFSGVDLDDDEGHVTATVVPDYPLQADQTGPNAGRRQFPESFLAALSPDMRSFFADSGSSSDVNKPPAPLHFTFDYEPPTTTTSTTSTTVAPTTSTTAAPTTSTTVAPTTSTTVGGPVTDLEAGTLDWGVKASFRSYVGGPIAHGTVTPSGGALANPDGTFRFPLSPGGRYDAADDLAVGFGGAVRFSGHDGALELTLSEPRVTVDGDGGTLVVDGRGRSLSTGEDRTFDDLEIADLDLSGIAPGRSGDSIVLAAVPATLTEQGAVAFAGFYEAGDDLDPVTLTLEPSAHEPGGNPSTSTTVASGPSSTTTPPSSGGAPVSLSSTSVTAGGRMTASGSGFLPGEQVQAYLHSTPRFLAVDTADAQGAVTIAFTVPADVPAGPHEVELRGVSSGHSITSATLTVTAAGAPGALPRTGADALDLLRWGLLALGVGLLASGRAQLRPAS